MLDKGTTDGIQREQQAGTNGDLDALDAILDLKASLRGSSRPWGCAGQCCQGCANGRPVSQWSDGFSFRE